MNKAFRLSITSIQHQEVKSHVFCGDGCESAAVLLCRRTGVLQNRFVVSNILLVPNVDCFQRTVDSISWPGKSIEKALDLAEPEGMSVILLHSHPGGLTQFSKVDDESDIRVMPSLFEGSISTKIPHGSAIMTPDGAIRARIYSRDLTYKSIEVVMCADEDISIWRQTTNTWKSERPMAFTSEMRDELQSFAACVIGISGTGSIVVEQLARMGIGKLILIDFDKVERKNLNRILNSTLEDAELERNKPDIAKASITKFRNDIEIICVNSSINKREAIIAAGDADFLFCCVDSLEARHICDRIASAFLQPLFDVAVGIPTRTQPSGNKAIGDVCGRIDYVKPGGPTLSDRAVYTPESLRAEYLHKAAPEDFDELVFNGYIRGLNEEAPSVISLNMRAASDCVIEFIARLYPFRHESNALRSRTTFSLAACDEDHVSEDQFTQSRNRYLGRGQKEPLLGMACFQTTNSNS